jgi:hypothetical protein
MSRVIELPVELANITLGTDSCNITVKGSILGTLDERYLVPMRFAKDMIYLKAVLNEMQKENPHYRKTAVAPYSGMSKDVLGPENLFDGIVATFKHLLK